MRLTQTLSPILFTLALSLSLSGCISYKYPKAEINTAPSHFNQSVSYKVKGGSILGGYNILKRLLRTNDYFTDSEIVDNFQEQGLFVDVDTNSIPPSIPALVFGYISFSSLGLLPSWSNQDGNDIVFKVYMDGKKIKTFEYPIRRKVFIWLPVAPALLFNKSEKEVFTEIGEQFFTDLRSVL